MGTSTSPTTECASSTRRYRAPASSWGRKSSKQATRTRGGKLGHPDSGLALEDDEVETRHGVVAGDHRHHGMRLAAMVGLVVEEMRQRRPARLRDLLGPDDRAERQRTRDVGIAQSLDMGDDAAVPVPARRLQRVEVLEQDFIEFGADGTIAGEAAHPDLVGDQQMAE